jgi:hypothetical protein
LKYIDLESNMSGNIVSNLMTAILMAPFLTIMAAVPLAMIQRGMEWITFIAKSPQKGNLKAVRPYVQQLEKVLDRILAGNKFTINSTNILLMGVIICLLALMMTKSQETVVKVKSQEKRE